MRRFLRLGRHRSVPVAILLINLCVPSRGQDNDARPPAGTAPTQGIVAGTAVVIKAPDLLLRGDGDDRPVPPRDGVSLKVERVDGNRVLVSWSNGRYRGWVGIDQVIPLDQAMAHFDRAIERDPKDVDALRMRGRLWSARKEYDRALADFDRAIQLAPDRAPAYVDRGRLRGLRSDLDQAVVDFSEAIRLDPKNASAYGQRAYTWVEKGDTAKGIAGYTEAIRLDPNDAWAYGQRSTSAVSKERIR